jgi:Winged helix-turn helix
MVLLRESGMTQPAIAAAIRVSLNTVNRAHMDFDRRGIKALKPKPSGGRLGTHSRIHLSLRRRLSAGWNLRLSDHVDIEYGVLPELPQCFVAKVCQAGNPVGPRRCLQPSLRRPRGSAQYYAAIPATLRPRTQSEGKSLG